MNIHKPEYKLNKAIKKLNEDPAIPETNKKIILDMADYILASGLSPSRAVKYVYYLKGTSKIFDKEFTKITKKDVTQFLKYIYTTDKLEEWTKHDYLVLTRKLYQWIKKEKTIKSQETKDAIQDLCDLKVKRAKSREKTPDHMLEPKEIIKIADHTTNSRNRAFILAFYESMTRIGEMLPVKIKDLKFDEYGCQMFVSGKTGFRPVRLIASQPAISNWLTNHPDRENPNAFLWCGIGRVNQKEMLSYAATRKFIVEAAKRAEIKKRVNLHKFRASRATELSQSLSDSVLCKLGGWVPGSQELQEYIYLSGKQADNAILELNGLIKREDTGNGFKMLVCPRCHVKNAPGSKFCNACSLGLDEKAIMEYDQQKDQATQVGFASMDMLKDPEFRKFYNEMLLATIEKYQEMKERK